VPAVYRTEINDVLLTALVQTFTQWTKGHSLLVDLEGTDEKQSQTISIYRGQSAGLQLFPVLLTLEGFPARGGTEGH